MLYLIGDYRVRLNLTKTDAKALDMRSFAPFEMDDDGGEVQLQVDVDDEMPAVPKSERRLVNEADTGNGITMVYLREKTVTDGGGCEVKKNVGYQFVINDIQEQACALLITDESFHHCRCALRGDAVMRHFGLNSVIMLCYAFSVAPFDTVLVHASLVRKDGCGYAFCAKSGTGKSTQVSNWLRYIPGCDLMNDDNPIIRITDDKVIVYGSPWSGKTPCYRNVKAPLGGIAQIVRAKENSLEPLKGINAFVTFLPSCSTMKWDERIYRYISHTMAKIVERVPMYNLHCLPDADSARVASSGMSTLQKSLKGMY